MENNDSTNPSPNITETTKNSVSIDFSNMKCFQENHDNNFIIGFCIDKNCKLKNKFICMECIFSSHSVHKLLKISELQKNINQYISIYSVNDIEDKNNKVLKNVFSTFETECEKLKQITFDVISNTFSKLESEIKDHFLKIQNENKIKNFDWDILKYSEIKNLSSDNLEKLNCFILNNFFDNEMNLNNFQKLKEENIFVNNFCNETEILNKNLKYFMEEIQIKLTEFFKNNLVVNPHNLYKKNYFFEWSEKCYQNFPFLFNLQIKNSKISKILDDSTISICRSKNKLEIKEGYVIEFLIDLKKGGDIDLGIGTDYIGNEFWIRVPNSYSISNKGIYENGKLTKKDMILEDGDIIKFEILLGEKNKTFKITKNKKISHEIKIELNEIYILAAIRKIGNSITVKDFKFMDYL